jgi:LysR family hydrogen peroxide-inducible transcriptional activator
MRFNFSLTQIEYVLAVHRYGHFAKAAAACYVTQPTLSMQIQKLEEDLGIKIFDRTQKPILLTDTGKKIIDQMQKVLFDAQKIQHIISESEQQPLKGELKIGIIPTLTTSLLPIILPQVEKLYPELELMIYEKETHHILESLDHDEIDVGVLAIPLKNPQFNEISLFFEPFSIVCQKSHELAKFKKIKHADLKSQDLWLLEEGHCLRTQVLDVCTLKEKNYKKRHFKFESGNLETLKKIIHSYGGYTLIPQLSLDNLSNDCTVVPFEKPIPAREVGLIFKREHYRIQMIQALEKSILEGIPPELKKTKNYDILPVLKK